MRNVKWIVVFAGCAGSMALAAPAQQVNPTPSPEVMTADKSGSGTKKDVQPTERKVCKTIQSTGSTTRGKKVCMTREQWKRASW